MSQMERRRISTISCSFLQTAGMQFMAEKRKWRKEKMGTEVSVCPDGLCVHRTSFRLTTSKGKTNPIFQHSYVINWQHCGTAKGANKRFFNTVTTYLILHTSIFPFGFFFSLLSGGDLYFFLIPRRFLLISSNQLSAHKTAFPSKNVRLLALHKKCIISCVLHTCYYDGVE